jgi:hypothetical protein
VVASERRNRTHALNGIGTGKIRACPRLAARSSSANNASMVIALCRAVGALAAPSMRRVVALSLGLGVVIFAVL